MQRWEWPGNSPDLNPIEHIMKCEVAKQKSTDNSPLIEILELVLYGPVMRKSIEVLVNSIPSRIEAVIEANSLLAEPFV